MAQIAPWEGGMGIEVLKPELDYFEKEKDNLLKTHAGKHVLIKGQKVVGTFDNLEEAYRRGLELFGVSPFLIKQVQKAQQTQQAPALTLGLLHAHL